VERNGQMGAIVPDLAPDAVFLIGHPTKSARDAIPAGFAGRVIDLGGDRRDPQELTDAILAELGPTASVVAVGNIHGQGELFLECLAELPLDDTDEPLTPLPEEDGLDQDTLVIALARPPQPEPYSWVAPLETPAHGIHVPGQRELARRFAQRQAAYDPQPQTPPPPPPPYHPTRNPQ
jgi:hypothetical protein